jgi:hypothetical protein
MSDIDLDTKFEETVLVDYNLRLLELYKVLIGPKHIKDKYCFVIGGLLGEVNQDELDKQCNKVIEKEGDADFQMISLIRLMYLLKKEEKVENHKEKENLFFKTSNCSTEVIYNITKQIEDALSLFPFWPLDGVIYSDKIVFWSENHILMTLSSSHLFRQWMMNSRENAKDVNNDGDHPEDVLLKVYLEAHASFNGLYESLSHVYLPFTFCALVNLIDFSNNCTIVKHATVLVNLIAEQILLCTTDAGIGNLCASSRAFSRTRLRTFDHNINNFIKVLTNKPLDKEFSTSSLTDFLITTKWRPNRKVFEMYTFNGYKQVKMNHAVDDIKAIYTNTSESHKINHNEFIPFYWSAGLVSMSF